MYINSTISEGLLDTGEDVTIIIPDSWHQNWSLQVAGVQFLGFGNLFQVKQSKKWN